MLKMDYTRIAIKNFSDLQTFIAGFADMSQQVMEDLKCLGNVDGVLMLEHLKLIVSKNGLQLHRSYKRALQIAKAAEGNL